MDPSSHHQPPAAPAPDELARYRRGELDAERFAAVDAWLATLTPDEAERLLGDEGRPSPLREVDPGSADGFVPAGGARLRVQGAIGSGGTATVASALDGVLAREVALKVLSPRAADEPLEAWLLRADAFRREAARTAALEHPAIVPVHDVGEWQGRPAFTMKRLAGETLEQAVAARGPRTQLIEALLRVAEAVAYAHAQGVVHRDLTPANVLLGGFGAVHVLDWGLAEAVGSGAGVRAGTPAWMAPEQEAGAAADPRMDVFALGGLLMLALTGLGPRPARDLDLRPLEMRGVPAGLAAVARRCLATDPAQRYPDGAAVAAELRRWLDEGLTLAQDAGPLARGLVRLRRQPALATGLAAGAALCAILLLAAWWSARAADASAQARLDEMARTVPVERPEVVRVALADVRAIRRERPALAAAAALESRFQAALDLAVRQEAQARIAARIDELLRRARQRGPGAGPSGDWRALFAEAGVVDAAALAVHPLRAALLDGLPLRWRAEREAGEEAAAAATARLLEQAGPDEAWRGLGRLLGRTAFRAHDPVFCACADSESALGGAGPTSAVLALFAPEERLERAAAAAIAQRPGDFWALLLLARSALDAGRTAEAERLALVASGVEPGSVQPRLLLAYAALERGDSAAVLAAADRGLATDPLHAELLVLRAAALARSGRIAEAQAIVDALDAAHLQYHLQHRVGHPMERSVGALVAAGIRIPAADPRLGPVHQHH